MKLKKDELSELLGVEASLRSKIAIHPTFPDKGREEFEAMVVDLEVAKAIVDKGETIIFSTDTMMQLLKNVDRIDTRGDLYLPYPYLIIQFTEPILEKELMASEEINDWQIEMGMKEDWIECLLITNPDQDPTWKRIPGKITKRNCIAWFTSTSLNRVSWRIHEDKNAEITYANEKVAAIGRINLQNKQRLIKLSYLINLFLNAPNVVLQAVRHPQVVQMKRVRKGKSKLPEYHTVTILKTVYESSGDKQKGTEHGHMYPVRGHFRKLRQYDNPIWIPNHFRGIKYGEESIPKEIYKVKNPKKNI